MDEKVFGISSKRSCRDIFWLLLFILYFLGMGFVGYQAYVTSSFYTLIYPKDSSGHFCGLDNSQWNSSSPDYTDKPYLYFVNPLKKTAAQVCVDKCPAETIASINITTAICASGFKPGNQTQLAQFILQQKCASMLYASDPVLYRCFPKDLDDLISLNSTVSAPVVEELLEYSDMATQIVGDFARTWTWFLAFAGFAALVSLVYLVLLRFFVSVFVWFVLIAAVVVVDGMVVFLYFAWQEKASVKGVRGFSTASMSREEQTYLGFFIVACVLAFLVNVLVIFMRKRIKTAIEVMKEASKAMQAMPLIALFPVFMFILMLALFAYWVAAELLLAAATNSPAVAGASYDLTILKLFQWYLLLGLFWGLQFFSGINQTTVSGAIATWYFTMDKRAMPSMPVWKSFGRVMRYHLGSIALGSLLVAIIEFIRVVIAFVQRQVKGANNRVTKSILTCCQCCFACVESLVKFINKNAYIEIAIYGETFCKASQQAFTLLVRNAFRLIAVESVSSFILFLGKLIVTCISGCGSYYLFKFYYQDNPLSYSAASVFVVMLIAYVVTSLFMYVYDTAIDTIFLCFCEDCERNDGSPERPYYMSQDLQVITNVKNVAPSWTNKVGDMPQKTREAFVDE